jgi:hypothetical protein
VQSAAVGRFFSLNCAYCQVMLTRAGLQDRFVYPSIWMERRNSGMYHDTLCLVWQNFDWERGVVGGHLHWVGSWGHWVVHSVSSKQSYWYIHYTSLRSTKANVDYPTLVSLLFSRQAANTFPPVRQCVRLPTIRLKLSDSQLQCFAHSIAKRESFPRNMRRDRSRCG